MTERSYPLRYQLDPPGIRGIVIATALRAAGRVLRPFGFKGLQRTAKYLGRIAARDQRCWLDLSDGSRFSFDLADHYWSRLLAAGYVYEPELVHAFQLIRDRRFLFLDCGANYGCWSLHATGPLVSGPGVHAGGPGCIAAIAVEASPATFVRLAEIAAANGGRFLAFHRAVLDSDDGVVEIAANAAHHAATSVQDASGDGAEAGVRTIGLDSLLVCAEEIAGGPAAAASTLVVVKLDIEGVERQVLEAAKAIWSRELLIIYEDHWKDRMHELTQAFLGQFKMWVYHVADDGSVRRIAEPGALDAIKTQRGRGYNFLAVRPGTAIQHRLAAAAGSV